MTTSPRVRTLSDTGTSQSTPPQAYKQQHRLLYRGSLSLPDSDLLLEGITFTARLPPTAPTALLESPIALALESMRGRPSLRYISRVILADVPHECTGEISMYIHPRSTLAREFLESSLCTERIGPSGHTTTAIRIGLGDGHGPEENDLLIYGLLLPSQSTLRMAVARVVPPRPPPPRIRPPRPDDPAPRRPPLLELARRNTSNKRRHSNRPDDEDEDRPNKRNKTDQMVSLKTLLAKTAELELPNVAAHAVSKGKMKAFKLPELPASTELRDGDPFGTPAEHTSARSTEASSLEVSNKTVIKKLAVKALAARGMPKEHPGFRELFGWVTRGVGFALRNKLKAVKLSHDEVERLVGSHVLMYFDGFGGPNAIRCSNNEQQ